MVGPVCKEEVKWAGKGLGRVKAGVATSHGAAPPDVRELPAGP